MSFSGDLEIQNALNGVLSNETLRGYSAYQIAVENGFNGTITEWLQSLKGIDYDHSEEYLELSKKVEEFYIKVEQNNTDYSNKVSEFDSDYEDKKAVIDNALNDIDEDIEHVDSVKNEVIEYYNNIISEDAEINKEINAIKAEMNKQALDVYSLRTEVELGLFNHDNKFAEIDKEIENVYTKDEVNNSFISQQNFSGLVNSIDNAISALGSEIGNLRAEIEKLEQWKGAIEKEMVFISEN